jgi:hypothetical protein
MPYDDPDPEDPHLLVGVSLPGDERITREMAEAFADEFAQMGFDRERLLKIFRNPFYKGAHAARALLGDAEITRIVVESLRAYGGRSYAVRDAEGEDEEPEGPAGPRGRRGLRVL